jgi:hypothetical protein
MEHQEHKYFDQYLFLKFIGIKLICNKQFIITIFLAVSMITKDIFELNIFIKFKNYLGINDIIAGRILMVPSKIIINK